MCVCVCLFRLVRNEEASRMRGKKRFALSKVCQTLEDWDAPPILPAIVTTADSC